MPVTWEFQAQDDATHLIMMMSLLEYAMQSSRDVLAPSHMKSFLSALILHLHVNYCGRQEEAGCKHYL